MSNRVVGGRNSPTATAFQSNNNKHYNLIINADDSVNLYFRPKSPEGKDANWVQSVPCKGWFVAFRFYEPLQGYFEDLKTE